MDRRGDADDRERRGRTPGPPAPWLLWLGFLGAPALWLVHFLLFYLAVEIVCAGDAGVRAAAWALGIGTVVFAVAAIALTWLAVHLGRRTLRTPEVHDDFLPQVGAITGAMAAFVLLLEAVPLLFVRVCG